jgi:phage gp29-like protein
MAKSRILGPDGQPVELEVLTEEIARPTMTGVRTTWGYAPIAGSLTPSRLAQVLLDAVEDWPRDYLTLAEEMEERDWHYYSVLSTRKRAVSGLSVTVEAASEEAADVKLADAIRELLKAPAFGDLADDCLDAIGKGYSAVEIVWDRSGKTWQPEKYVWRDPRFFRFDYATQSELLLLTDEAIMGVPLPAYKFITHRPKLKSGLTVRGGLARLAAAAYMCKSYTLTDWMAFAEVFGMPLRIGRYSPGATQADINTLISAVANIGTDAAAILPKGMDIEFSELQKTSDGGAQVFNSLADWLDRQVSKAVLGQTSTTDAISTGMGSNTANVHNDVRSDIQISDARQLSNTISCDLVKAYIDLNFGKQERYPRVHYQVVEPEDVGTLAEALSKLVPVGLRVSAAQVREKIGFSEPKEGDEIMQAPAPVAPPAAAPAPANLTQRARNRAQPPRPPPIDDTIDELGADALRNWQELIDPMADPVRALAAHAETEEDFVTGLASLIKTMAPDALLRSLASAAFKARALGEVSDDPER